MIFPSRSVGKFFLLRSHLIEPNVTQEYYKPRSAEAAVDATGNSAQSLSASPPKLFHESPMFLAVPNGSPLGDSTRIFERSFGALFQNGISAP